MALSSVPVPESSTAFNDSLHECPDCGLINRLPEAQIGTDARCIQCAKILRRVHRHSLDKAMACTLAGLCFFAVAVSTPLLTTWLTGSFHFGTLLTGPYALDDQGAWGLACVVGLTTIVMPFLKLSGILVVLLGIRRDHPPHWLAPLFGLLKHLNVWAMVEIYLLGFLVAYTRLHIIMQVHIGVALYALVGVMISIAGLDATLDPESVWQVMEQKNVVKLPPLRGGTRYIGCETCHQVTCAQDGDACPRCGEELSIRKPFSLQRTWALTIGAAIFYVPSNYFPIMTIMKFGKVHSYTIYEGLKELFNVGLWPLAVIVFVASILIPLFKLLSLVYMLIQIHRRSDAIMCTRTKLFRLIEFIGRWSMIDIYMVSILVALVHFGYYTLVTANIGAAYFATVVVFTIFAVETFDPRLMWDAARLRAGSREASGIAYVLPTRGFRR